MTSNSRLAGRLIQSLLPKLYMLATALLLVASQSTVAATQSTLAAFSELIEQSCSIFTDDSGAIYISAIVPVKGVGKFEGSEEQRYFNVYCSRSPAIPEWNCSRFIVIYPPNKEGATKPLRLDSEVGFKLVAATKSLAVLKRGMATLSVNFETETVNWDFEGQEVGHARCPVKYRE